jgi:predicted Rossmann-fold nucleotide-binding protein
MDYLAQTGMISPGDVNLFKIVDSVEDAFRVITKGLLANKEPKKKVAGKA